MLFFILFCYNCNKRDIQSCDVSNARLNLPRCYDVSYVVFIDVFKGQLLGLQKIFGFFSKIGEKTFTGLHILFRSIRQLVNILVQLTNLPSDDHGRIITCFPRTLYDSYYKNLY